MEENPHLTELLQRLSALKVEFLIVGGYAVMKYGEPRFTKDLDIWIRSTPENADRVYIALAEFGAPLDADGLTVRDFASPGIIYQLGRAPLRVDIMTSIDGVDFKDAWLRRNPGRLMGVDVNFISLDDLIRNKEASGRSSDLEHLKLLRRKRKN